MNPKYNWFLRCHRCTLDNINLISGTSHWILSRLLIHPFILGHWILGRLLIHPFILGHWILGRLLIHHFILGHWILSRLLIHPFIHGHWILGRLIIHLLILKSLDYFLVFLVIGFLDIIVYIFIIVNLAILNHRILGHHC